MLNERLHILVAEDCISLRLLLAATLTKRSHIVRQVENGTQAVEAVARGSFDLIFMDIEMPEIDGLEATRLIRALRQPYSVPIVAVTTQASKHESISALKSGMNHVISKPFAEKDIDTALAFPWRKP
jgi:CheY-like chemotaxis protein